MVTKSDPNTRAITGSLLCPPGTLKVRQTFRNLLSAVSCLAGAFLSHVSWADEISIAVFESHRTFLESPGVYGVSWRLLEKAAADQNVTLRIEPGSWQASMFRLKASKVDLIFYAVKSPDREEWASFSLPFVAGGSAIFTHHFNPVTELDKIDLINDTVGVPSQSVQERFVREFGFKKVYTTSKRNQLYKMLSERRLDYLFFGIGGVYHYCKTFDRSKKTDCLRQVGPLFNINTVHVMGQDTPRINAIIEKINQGVRNTSQDEDVLDIFKQYNLDENKYLEWQDNLAKIDP